MKKLVLVLSLFFLVGCISINPSGNEASNQHIFEESGSSIDEYFEKNVSVYFEKELNTEVSCLSGNCPTFENARPVAKGCFFCDSAKLMGDALDINVGPSGSADSWAGCTETFSFDGIGNDESDFEIIEKTDEKIVARGYKTGNVKRSGDCDEEYEYDFKTNLQFTFYKEEPKPEVELFSHLKGDGDRNYVFTVEASPDSNNPNTAWWIEVTCSHPEEIQTTPSYALMKVYNYTQYDWVNGVKSEEAGKRGFTHMISAVKDEESETKARFEFYSFYGAEYLIDLECVSYYANGKRIIGKGDMGLALTVTGNPLPEKDYIVE